VYQRLRNAELCQRFAARYFIAGNFKFAIGDAQSYGVRP
jgi:hypothetical protein